jgi:dihydropteroate synthase
MAVIVAGVLNLTPDSFSDGGGVSTVDAAVEAAVAMVDAGAQWIDVGGESTRPRSQPVSQDEEIGRVVPVIRALAVRLAGRAQLSVDTYKSGTAKAALDAGASIVNDVSGGLLDASMLDVCARAGATVILGHLRGRPATMMENVHFDDVVAEVGAELGERVAAARVAGCRTIWADPGIGFGKYLPHNLALLGNLGPLCEVLAVPVMVGVSRKRFLGDLTGKSVEGRTFATAGAVAAAVLGGAAAVRVHDVAPMADVVKVAEAIASSRGTLPSTRMRGHGST